MKSTVRTFHLLLILLLAAILPTTAQEQQPPVRVACVGNSITFGSGIQNRDRDSYPAVLGQLLGRSYDVRNFGISARTTLMKGDNPYRKEQICRDALAFRPDIAIIKLGTNDSKPWNWRYGSEYTGDLRALVNDFQRQGAKVYLCLPDKVYSNDQWGISDSVIVRYIIPKIREVAKATGSVLIDLHTTTSGMPELFPDLVHPNEQGAAIMAETICQAITGQEVKYTPQAFPGFRSTWNGGDRYDFRYRDRDVTVVAPAVAAKGRPWIWRPAFFDAFPSVDKALLAEGFHVVYYDLTHGYGSPRTMQAGTDFYRYMTQTYQLAPKVTLEGFSRGGLCALNWAARNVDKVACIYLDAPVCDLNSWPGRQKNPPLWNDMLREWGLTDEAMATFTGNPIDNLDALAEAGIPIFAVCGDSDRVVPYAENMGVLRDRYVALGGPVEVILKPGVDHHPHSLDNPEPVVTFILRNQPGYQAYQHITQRGSLRHSFQRFEHERRGRVAFVGGSITEMNGWKDMIERQLQQRFPYTTFEFVEAGIASTGTTPGAFRLKNDVLSKGPIDLLFVEAAVNDDTNHFTPIEQVRGMEGEVRHALEANPLTDVVMLHFIYDPFIPMFAKGQIPDVMLNHDRVANHYLIPSINLAWEVASRMQDGEFTWKDFGGTHPAPLGHAIYAAAINRLFDLESKHLKAVEGSGLTELEALPPVLDPYSYTQGGFLPLTDARLGKGWEMVANWHPANKAGTRRGFVDVPMLAAYRPGDRLTLPFEGRAIGIFCVAGPDAGILEYSVDGGTFQPLDLFTEWSAGLYLPWVYMFETELAAGRHTLTLRIAKEKNSQSTGTACIIRNFVVNQ